MCWGETPESVYKPLDILKTCREFYAGIGLPIDDVLKRSSLYEQPGKNPHAFCIDIDRAGDVRILENVVPGHEWLATSLHELGHAIYSKNVSSGLPYVLHTDAHPLCTEGVAMMFERFAQERRLAPGVWSEDRRSQTVPCGGGQGEPLSPVGLLPLLPSDVPF